MGRQLVYTHALILVYTHTLRTFRDLTVMFMKFPDGSEVVREEEP